MFDLRSSTALSSIWEGISDQPLVVRVYNLIRSSGSPANAGKRSPDRTIGSCVRVVIAALRNCAPPIMTRQIVSEKRKVILNACFIGRPPSVKTTSHCKRSSALFIRGRGGEVNGSLRTAVVQNRELMGFMVLLLVNFAYIFRLLSRIPFSVSTVSSRFFWVRSRMSLRASPMWGMYLVM